MSLETDLIERSESRCELCRSEKPLIIQPVSPFSDDLAEHNVMICSDCQPYLESATATDLNHWRGLGETMWTPVPAVQVLAWRILKQLETESWAQDLLAMLYLEDDVQSWAQTGGAQAVQSEAKDSNGAPLNEGDSVTLIKDLDVKGANFTAKRGTLVKGIHLTDNPEQIEGKVNGMRIVLLTQFLKKA